jgi:hypothetical protein
MRTTKHGNGWFNQATPCFTRQQPWHFLINSEPWSLHYKGKQKQKILQDCMQPGSFLNYPKLLGI